MYTDSIKRPGRALVLEALEDRWMLDATSFVTSLYENLLHRAPDSAGLAAWVAALNNGATNVQVATDFWNSAEHRTVQVTGYYERFLNRAPDSSGESGWVNDLLSGSLNEQGVEQAFLTSSEFQSAHSTPAAYVVGLYEDLLGRVPSYSDQQYWENTLLQSSYSNVAESILTTTERYVDIITNDYQTYLNRAPDTAGEQAWLASMLSGGTSRGSLAVGILGSAEYARDH